jgi:hypothetical protein
MRTKSNARLLDETKIVISNNKYRKIIIKIIIKRKTTIKLINTNFFMNHFK